MATTPAWLAARSGLPADTNAVNHAAQVSQFLGTHGITAVYAGTQIITSAGYGAIDWINLGVSDVDQPFAMPGGKTTIGRVTLPLSPAGAGADVTVSLYTDSGGSPGTLITSTRVPAAWIAQLAAPSGLASGGPLATALSNTMAFGAGISVVWTQPAVSLNGSGNYACPVTSGSYTILLGGFDVVGSVTVATVATIQYLGGQAISGPMPQPSLPRGAWFAMAATTPDTVVFAGGINGGSYLANVWTASWDPSTGTAGAWTAQAALPQITVGGGMAAWQHTVYVAGGNTANSYASATANVYYASAVNQQIQAWTAGPPLPLPVSNPYVAAVSGWLIVAGGVNASGTPVTTVYYAKINPDGSLDGWQAGPSLPVQGYAYSPGWNLAVTDSAMVIVSGAETSGSASLSTQVLPVTADGPASAWQVQSAVSSGDYQVAFYPGGNPGEWEVFNLHLTWYDASALTPVPLVSVPLPATGLTPGSTYHIVVHQDGGDLNDYTQIALDPNALATAAQTRPNGGGSWTGLPSTLSMLAGVWDQTAGGNVLHTWEDSGARITSLIYAGASGQLLGACEATVFGDGTMLADVAQVTYDGTVPAGVVQLA